MLVTLYKKTISRLLILVACLFLGQLVNGQQYPVQIVPQLLPPYTLNVSDYYNGTSEKLVLLLTNTDLNKATLQVRLRMSIQGQAAKLISRDNVYYPPVSLDGGVPTRISLSDLAPYFRADNLIFEGITRAQYVQSGKLPEGFYQFCFEAVEVNSGQVVGRSSCAMAWISLSDPPLLNMPRTAESIVYKDPQNIIFQWTPRNYNSPTSAFNTEYEFTLVEIWDNGLAPEAAFGTAQPLYRTTTQATTLLYGPGEPLLLSGHKYAWRVRAQQTDGSKGSDAFRNNGYSEIFWFNCQNNCAAPLNVQHELSGGRATITWAANPNQSSFTVDYREKGQDGTTWYNTPTTANRMMVYDLKKDKTYEYRVGGTCDNGLTYTYSDIKTLVTPAADSAVNTECGLLEPEANIANRTPIQTLLTGDVITAGDFPVKLLQVSGQGTFTGAGYVTVPFIGQSRVKVKFNGITVNTDKQLIGGVIETTYDAKESQIGNLDKVIEGGGDVGIVVNGVDTAGYYIDMVIPDASHIAVELNSTADSSGNAPAGGATLAVTGSDGKVEQVKVEELPATIKDKNGTIYGVDKEGNVSKVASTEAMNMTSTELNSIKTDKAVVKFLPHGKQQYAFDEYQPVYKASVLFREKYEKLNDNYYVNSKAIVEAKTDVVKAVVEIKDKSIVVDSIRFVTGKGTRYESTLLADSTSWEIRIVGGPAADAQELYALYPQGGGKFLSLGKLLIASYPERTFKLVLVPVNGASVNKDAISQKLDAIYKPVGISFQVTQDQSFDDNSWDLVHDNKLAVSGSGWLSTLTDEMKALNKAYSSARSVQQDAVYLFVLDGSDSTIAGDMPRGKQFGYLFTGSNGNVVAHELGHGLFKLKHTFDSYGFQQGELSGNVMDYPAGYSFTKYQWDQIHDPGIAVGIFDSEGDGQSLAEAYLKCVNDDKIAAGLGKIFYDPIGQTVQLDDDMTPYAFFGSREGDIYGNLAAFKKGGKIYLYLLYSGGANAGEYGGVYGTIDGTNKSVTLKVVHATAKQVKIDDKNKLEGRQLANCSCNNLTKVVEPGNEVKVADKKTGKVTKGTASQKEEIKICDSDPYNLKHELAVQAEDGTTTWGEKIVKQLNYQIETNKKNKFGDNLLMAKLNGVSYISTGHDYKNNPVFQGGYKLEELDSKMAYLEISKGYQFYTRFIQTTCTVPQQVADKFAQDVFDKSAISKEKGIICLVLYNNKAPDNDPQQYTIGLAFGSGVSEATGIREILNAADGDVRETIVGKLIHAYRSIPKKRIVFNYFISRPTAQQISERNALRYADKPYPELRGVLKSTVDNIESETGNALAVRYFIAEATSDKIESEIIDEKKALKEEYVVDESVKVALNYAVKYADWNLYSWDGSTAKDDKIVVSSEPVVTACHFTLGKPCDMVAIDNLFFVATLFTPQKLMFIPVAAAVVYYGATDQWNEAGAYLGGYLGYYVLTDVCIPVLKYAASKTYSLIKFGPKGLKDIAVALEFRIASSKGLPREAIETLFAKQLSAEVAEYLIPNELTKNLWIKTENSGGQIGKVLVGSVEGNTVVVRGYREGTKYVIESIDEVRLKQIAEEVMEFKAEANAAKAGENPAASTTGNRPTQGQAPSQTQTVTEGRPGTQEPTGTSNQPPVEGSPTTSIGTGSQGRPGEPTGTSNQPAAQGSPTTEGQTGTQGRGTSTDNQPPTQNTSTSGGGTTSGAANTENTLESWLTKRNLKGSHIDDLLANAGSARAALMIQIENWEASILRKLNADLERYPTLGSELIAAPELLNHWHAANTKWWYKYALLREVYLQSSPFAVPPGLQQSIEDLQTIGLVRVGSVRPTNRIPDLGNLFEDDLIAEIGSGFRNSGNFDHLPPDLKTKMDDLYNQGYNVMLTQSRVKLTPWFTNKPQPDLLFFRANTRTFEISFTDIVYIDGKITPTTSFSTAQKNFNSLKGTGKQVSVFDFAWDKNPEIFFTGPPDTHVLDDVLNKPFTLKEVGKIATEYKNNTFNIVYKLQ
ncbi:MULTISPECIES: hypothetical protein [Niastella]|uniref:Fibronectin type-III domain-containing protein n=1 Tax=Niastella soli TaxID=2821487 RepID=A0ABS3YYN4_9BACT|nr:hypothetical protein [Niastella soli]MBO9203039.1 hypothetical protein [Niastella soli]